MTELVFGIVVLLVIFGCAAMWVRLPWQDQALEGRARKIVVVTMKSGETIQGVLWEWDVDNVVLRQAEMLGQPSSRIPVDGELLLRWADVGFVQLPG